MPQWNIPSAAPQQIDVLLFDEFSALCLANAIEPMRAANRLLGREVYRWRFLGLDKASATSSSGMAVAVQGADDLVKGDMLIIMPSYGFLADATPRVTRAVKAAANRYKVLAGFDTGSWLLAQAGLLDGRDATIHWEVLDQFTEAFPHVNTIRQRSVIDGNRITCSGAQAAFDLMLDLISDRHGAALRVELALLFMTPEKTTPQDAPVAKSRAVERAIRLMQENIEAPLPIGQIARLAGRHQKDLERRMRAELGASPQQVYRRIRLLAARRLLRAQDLAVTEVALRVGYQNASAMTRAYRVEFGNTPRDERDI